VRRGLRWLDKREAGERFFLFLHTYEVHEYSPPPETAALLVRPYEGFLDGLERARAAYVQDRGFDDEGRLPAPGPAERRFLTDLYDACIRSADGALRELWLGLEERGLTKDTLLVVTSDHGEELFERDGTGHGYTLHDENVHVPLILAHPSLPARRVAAQVRLIDVAPTLVDWLGVAPPGEWQGVHLGPFIDGEAGDLPAVSEQAHAPFVALRRGGL
jgi:arylsulfatase A-like enzyme